MHLEDTGMGTGMGTDMGMDMVRTLAHDMANTVRIYIASCIAIKKERIITIPMMKKHKEEC